MWSHPCDHIWPCMGPPTQLRLDRCGDIPIEWRMWLVFVPSKVRSCEKFLNQVCNHHNILQRTEISIWDAIDCDKFIGSPFHKCCIPPLSGHGNVKSHALGPGRTIQCVPGPDIHSTASPFTHDWGANVQSPQIHPNPISSWLYIYILLYPDTTIQYNPLLDEFPTVSRVEKNS